MRIAVYPGSFDPITIGHLDIIERASKVFDEIIVGVFVNPDKKGLFTISERVSLIERVTSNYPNVTVQSCSGLLVNFMKANNAKIIVKGLRAVSDFEYEFHMSMMNNKLEPTIETVFMMTSAKYLFLSSSSVRQIAMFGGCVKGLVPDEIIKDIMDKTSNNLGG
ncbi:MAG: pantetheine-phosphate adenylyltransferase [Clostridiaceae bacterium]|nr:pantetheine-phosphate adenylyltransferase [Clostridiaceae bacterium]